MAELFIGFTIVVVMGLMLRDVAILNRATREVDELPDEMFGDESEEDLL